MSEQSLSQKFTALSDLGALKKEIPSFIADNLASSIALRHYQNKALERFLYYIEDYPARPRPSHLLFHMATGSGKTVLMASLILRLYAHGYRNFLFFVNSGNIIDKTKENFLNPVSSKYLFAQDVVINDKRVNIREVANFDEAVDTDINIHFSTIQGLHSRLQNPKENAVTLEDFENRKIVLISDEAHHINTLTKKSLGKDEQAEVNSWESTVSKIFQSDKDNLLLEFTATIELEHSAIKAKYHDKILYDYSLRQFREDGYSKDVEVRQAHLPTLERMFQAVILSQYRRKVAEAHGLQIKPVILMKSKTIGESKNNEEAFHSYIARLKEDDLKSLCQKSAKDETIHRACEYFFNEKGICHADFIRELFQDFSPEKTINVNSSDDLEKQQILLNSLEDYSNEIRVVFAVDKLNEGWDVLNLFDIVRLYDTRDSGKKTIQEAQLIGRGARYCPFIAPDQTESPREKRKYDKKADHPLRVLEELHYHCSHNPKYIQEIKAVLRETGIIGSEPRKVTLKVKDSFKESDFFKKQFIYLNEKVANKRDGIFQLSDYLESKHFNYPHLMTGRTVEEAIFEDSGSKVSQNGEAKLKTFSLSDFGWPTLRRAIDGNDFFYFDNLKHYFPKLEAEQQFIELEKYLAKVTVDVRGLPEQLEALHPKQKLDIALFVLSQVESTIRHGSTDYVGSKEFTPKPIAEVVVDKTIKIDVAGERGLAWKESTIAGLHQIDLFQKKWHIYDESYGTSEEKNFIRFISERSDDIEDRYDEFYLVRNEKLFQIYNFSDGRAFEPDFVLFLKAKASSQPLIYQLFVEPKGRHIEEGDKWKEDFLKSLEADAKLATIFQGKDYKILGMPFFNEEGPTNNAAFKDAFEPLLNHQVLK